MLWNITLNTEKFVLNLLFKVSLLWQLQLNFFTVSVYVLSRIYKILCLTIVNKYLNVTVNYLSIAPAVIAPPPPTKLGGIYYKYIV